MTIAKNGSPILSLDDWRRLAPPKADFHWADHRSAKEVARAWLNAGTGNLPLEVASCIQSHADFSEVVAWRAEPEARLPFDAFLSEPSNADLAVQVTDNYGDYFLAVEAKADEPFSKLVMDTLAAALDARLKKPQSNALARIENLAAAILGPPAKTEPSTGKLRYQLLTASACALCEAERRGVSRAVLLVQEFVTDRTDDEKHQQNAEDLNRFLHRLSHDPAVKMSPGSLVGPFRVPGAPLLRSEVKFYVGKVTRSLRAGGA